MKLTYIWPTLGQHQSTEPRRNGSTTKKGPGRRHANGCKRARPALTPLGEWTGQHTNPAANARRAVKAQIGACQRLALIAVLARAARESA